MAEPRENYFVYGEGKNQALNRVLMRISQRLDTLETLRGRQQLTTPWLNEEVGMTATSTELNQLDGRTVGGSEDADIPTVVGVDAQIQTAASTENYIQGQGSTDSQRRVRIVIDQTAGEADQIDVTLTDHYNTHADMHKNIIAGLQKGESRAVKPGYDKGTLISFGGTGKTLILTPYTLGDECVQVMAVDFTNDDDGISYVIAYDWYDGILMYAKDAAGADIDMSAITNTLYIYITYIGKPYDSFK